VRTGSTNADKAVDELIRLCGSLPLAPRMARRPARQRPGPADSRPRHRTDRRQQAGSTGAGQRHQLSLADGLFGLVPRPGTRRHADCSACSASSPERSSPPRSPQPCCPHRAQAVDCSCAGRSASDRTRGGGPVPVPRSPSRVRAGACAGGGDGGGPWRRAGTAPDLVPAHAARAASGTFLFPELPPELRACDQQGKPSAAEATQWLEAERANLLAAINHAALHGPRPVAWHLASVLFGHFWIHLPRTTWLTTAQTALDAATDEGDLRGQAAINKALE